MSSAYGGSVLPDRVDTDIRACDGKNKDGGSQGAVLKTSIL